MNNITRHVVAVLFLATASALSFSTGLAHAEASGPVAQVDLRVAVTEHPNEVYEPRTRIQVPDTHTIGDHVFPYEGIGWENELIGYRLYLDGRAVTDAFGKKTPDPVLHTIDYRSRYHDAAPWGRDVLHVGPSLGLGGLGILRNGKMERFGDESDLFAEVLETGGKTAALKIKHRNTPVAEGVTANVDATYTLKVGSPITLVTVNSTAPPETLVTGLVIHKAGKPFKEAGETTRGQWWFIASWGPQSDQGEDLGLVVFFRNGEGRLLPPQAGTETRLIRLNAPTTTYAFAAIWGQGPMGITDEAAFLAWCEAQRATLPPA
jgi:hypothetical protein